MAERDPLCTMTRAPSGAVVKSNRERRLTCLLRGIRPRLGENIIPPCPKLRSHQGHAVRLRARTPSTPAWRAWHFLRNTARNLLMARAFSALSSSWPWSRRMWKLEVMCNIYPGSSRAAGWPNVDPCRHRSPPAVGFRLLLGRGQLAA